MDRETAAKPPATRYGAHQRGEDIPFETSDIDRVRIKLREQGRRRAGHSGTSTLVTLPGVQSLALATRYIDGGRARFVEFVQMAVLNGDLLAQKWWLVYADLLPAERATVSFDDVCAASGVAPKDLMALVVSTAMEYGTDVGNLVAAALHPAVVHQAAKSAKRIGGQWAEIAQRDRQMLFQHQNFIPIPKGATVHVHASANAQAAAAASAEPTVPAFAADMEALRATRQVVQRQLTEADATLAPLEAAVVPEAVEG